LRDRFGEAPEEVENLLSAVVLRLAGARIGLTRIGLDDDEVTLGLPPQEVTAFYEDSSGEKPLFQMLMETIGAMHHPRLQLRQEGKQLFLRGVLAPETEDRISAVRDVLRKLSQALDSKPAID